MKLYVTPNGHWTGTQADAAKATRAEGSKPGSWKAVTVPTDKANLLAFLNHGWKAPEPAEEPRPAPKRRKGKGRYRAFFKGLFAGVVQADNQTQAEERAADLLELRLVTSR